MIKKIFKVIGSFFLVLLILIIAMFGWSFYSYMKYDEMAIPFINENLPLIATWDYEKYSHLFTAEAREILETEKGRKILSKFSELGALKSYDDPVYLKSESGVFAGRGAYEVFYYSIPATFEAGKANITLLLTTENDKILIYRLNIDSEVFLNKAYNKKFESLLWSLGQA